MSEQSALRRAFARVERQPGEPYPEALRKRATTWARSQRKAGVSWQETADALGVHVATVRVWCTGEVQMRRVEVVTDDQRVVSVASPSGYRVEGLTLPEAAALLSKLG
jgi:hypothetical protein